MIFTSLPSFALLAALAAPEDRVDAYMNAAMADGHIPGASLIVLKDGKVVKRAAYGLASVEYDIPARPETLYLLASMTKSFTATAILMLVEEGKIKLDESISVYLADAPEAWTPITVRMLLGHTAGLKDRWEEPDQSRWRLAYSTADLYAAAKATPLDFAPGTRWQYGDQGYFLLGKIVEQVSGVSYRQFLTGRIFKPCGMDASTTTSQTEIVKNLAQGYTLAHGQLLKNHRRTDFGLVSHFGIVSNVDDLAKFDQTLAAGRLVKPETLAAMWSPTMLPGGDVGRMLDATYGMGWFLEGIDGHRIVQHGGASGTGYVKYPDDHLTVIVLTNLEQLAGGDGIGLAKVVAQAYVTGLGYAALAGRTDPDPKLGDTVKSELAHFAGGTMTAALYTPEFARLIEPTLPAQKAGLGPLGPAQRIEYLSETRFGASRSAVYRVRYKDLTLYLHLVVDPEGKLAQMAFRPETSIDG